MEEIKAIWPGWEVVGQLGSGSFGSVYEIQRTIRGRTEHAAVKVLTIPQNKSEIAELRADGYDDESITQYLADSLDKIESEYAMMADMKGHSNVVYCDDLRTEAHEDGFGWDIYIKMELLVPLKSALREDAVQEQTARLGMDMCGALELCEKMNIVHRDIKPENIFVSRDGTYKLGDFGIARTMEGTTGGTKTGTYDYMAPEVYNNRPYHNQADIYSLGLVMYWLLNERTIPFLPIGARPTPSIKAAARERRFSGEALPAPKNGSDALKAIVLKACAFDPKERYASAAEMREDLRKLDTGAVFVPPVIPVAPVEPVSGGDGTVNIFTGQQEKPAEPMEGTVNLFSGHMAQEKTEYIKEEKTEYIREEKTEYIPRSAPIPEEKKKKKNWLFPVIAVVLVIAILLVMLRSCGDKPVGPGETTGSIPGTTQTEGTTAPTTGETTVPPTTEATEAPSVPTVPQQAEWSGWLDSLPEYVSNENYLIEELTLYRSREMETTTSTTQNTMDGWEHYDTVEADGGYGPWSDWSGTAVSATDSRQVETQQRYRYRNKEFTTGTSSAKNGWTLYNTTYAWSSYGSWSGWSTAKVTASDSRKVETKTQYRYANKLTTSSTQSSMSGWTQSGSSTSWSDYGSWSEWSKWAVDASDSRQVESEYRYLYYCFICSNCGARIPYQSEDREGICHYELGGCGSTDYSADYQEKYLSNPPSDAKIWNLAYLGSKCLIVDGLRWYIDRDDDPIMTYRYRDRTQITTYYYWKWGTWSAWSDDVYSASAERRVETCTMYRYCDRTQIPTYHFWRWGSWSDWTATAVSGNDSRQVEKTTYYRYREYVTTTTYCFRRWKAWSDYSEIPVSPAETVEVETKTQYRFKSK